MHHSETAEWHNRRKQPPITLKLRLHLAVLRW
uniref:Uncharacterized protein n=1 Tax=Siphoviridae sp. ctEJj1 TaxID=2825395 RepID=A0A8S5U6G3_9CAUD|nr:MAG TPA: hypothetical protein [Siphoviridae sp. ctEJj1]